MLKAILAAGLFLTASAVFAQYAAPARSGGAAAVVPAAPELSPEAAARLAQMDELSGAIVKRDAKRVSAWIRAHKELNFNFDEVWRGRTFQSPLTLAVSRDFVDIARILLEGGAQAGRNDGDGRAAIHYARSAEAVQLLAQNGVDVNAQDRYGRTALANAVERGNLQAVDMLIASRARLDVPMKGTDLLTRAIESRHPEMIIPLLDRGLDPRTPPTRALWLLIESGNTETALQLIRRGADVNLANDRGETLLTRALFRQRWEVAEALIDAGANLRLPDRPGCRQGGFSCQSLQIARLASFNPRVLAKLAEKGLDVNVVAADGHSALSSLIVEQPLAIRAVRRANTAVGVAQNAVTGEVAVTTSPRTATVRDIPAPDNVARMNTLLDLRADPNLKYRDATPLMLAVALPGKPPGMADALLRAGGRIEIEATIVRPGPDDRPRLPGADSGHIAARNLPTREIELIGMSVGPLTWAASRGRPDIALRLLEQDKRVTRADRHLLYFTAAAGQWDLLLGALPYIREVDASDRADVTPLMLAADAGHAGAVRALLSAGASVNARSVRNWPPLSDTNFAAALAGHSPTPPKLAGGYTALRAAREKGHTDVVRILTEAGGRE